MIQAILVDDEQRSIDVLSNAIGKHCPMIQIVGQFTNIDSAYSFLIENKPQLVFLDVDLSPDLGFDLLKKFVKPPFEVIFVTAYDHYAIEAIKFSALYYLLKPVNVMDLRDAVQKAIERIESNEVSDSSIIEKITEKDQIKKIALVSHRSTELIDLEYIIYLEANNSYTTFMLKDDRKITVSKNIAEYEKMLLNKGFFRIHKSYIVNLQEVQSLDKNEGTFILLKNKSKLPISYRRVDEFLKVYH